MPEYRSYMDFLWFSPWQAVLQDLTWLRLGIALLAFMVPGISIYVPSCWTGSSNWGDRITFGFVLSHLLIALLGCAGRVFHFSFDLIKNSFMVLGIVFLLLSFYPILARGFSFRVDRTTFRNIASFWTVGLVAVFVILIVVRREFSDDDLSYLAFLNNTQYSAQLSFNDIFFGLAQPVSSRFWLMSAPFAQAFLADLGGIRGILLLSGYYEPFLAVIAIICWYGLARALKLSHQAASMTVILQILFLLLLSEHLHPGAPFFHQISADKATATFILVPVFIQSEIWLLGNATRKNGVLFLLCGLSLTFMHPIALAYAAIIGGLLLILDIDRNTIRTRWVPALVIVISLLPQVALRFVNTPDTQNVPYSLKLDP
ncbi:MAG: DUF6077 domain-containing protein [Anaerolineales bacterium]